MHRLIRPLSLAALAALTLSGAAAFAAPPRVVTRVVAVPADGSGPPAELAGPEDGPPGSRRDRRVVVLSDDGARDPMVFRGLSGAYLGVELTELTPELRSHFGVPDDRGVMIGHVEEDSPAAAAGLAVGDIVTAIDGEPVESSWDLSVAVRRHEGGDSVALEVWRDGRSLDLSATLEEREREQIDLGRLLPLDGLPPMKGMRWIQRPDGKDGKETTIVVRPEIVRELGKSLQAVDWPELDGRLRERNQELEDRLEKLEERLHDLEKRLDETAPEH